MEQYEKKLKGMSICSVPFRKSKMLEERFHLLLPKPTSNTQTNNSNQITTLA